MVKPKYDLNKILPHNPPMIFLDDVIEYDSKNRKLSASFKIYPKKMFFDSTINGINSLAGLEFMAQAIGCYSYFSNGCQEPKPGLLLGTRLFNNTVDKFNNGEEYKVIVQESYSDNEIFAFDCQIKDANDIELQDACIKVFKSEDIEEMLNG